jgi:hypothetical protein
MLWASALTAPFGLTEFLFVPAYWNPPNLFDLAHRTGFDIESFIFCFAIGGLAAAGYRVLAPTSEHALAPPARNSHLHRWHRAALVSPFFVFGALLMLPWNPIYPEYCGAVRRRIGKWPVQTRSVAQHVRRRCGVSCTLRNLPARPEIAVAWLHPKRCGTSAI